MVNANVALKASATGNVYYIDYTYGSDSNNGLSVSTPWKTLGKVSTVSFSAGDTISLKCGEIWNESVQLWGQGTKANPITLTSYGTGNKPKIRSSAYSVVSGVNVGGWKIKGIAVECTTTDLIKGSNRNSGIQFNYETDGHWANITIEDNEIFCQGINRNCDGIRISMVYPYTRQTTTLSDILIKNNLIHDVGWTGISTVAWNTTENQDMRSIELIKNIKILNNTVYNTGNQGITLHSARYGAIKWNLVHDCGIYTGTGVAWGAGAIW